MKDQLKSLYKQIKEQAIDPKEAIRKMQELKTAQPREIAPEIYRYNETYLKDHTVFDEQVILGVTHGSLAINAFFRLFPTEQIARVSRLNFIKPITVEKDQKVEVQVDPTEKGEVIDFQVKYRYSPDTPWDLTATGRLQKGTFEKETVALEELKSSMKEIENIDLLYTGNPVVKMGESFKTLTNLYVGENQTLGRVFLSRETQMEDHDYALHPLVTNSVFLAASPLLAQTEENAAFLPFGIKDLTFLKSESFESCWLRTTLVKNSGEMVTFNAELITDNGTVILRYKGCSLKKVRTENSPVTQKEQEQFPSREGWPRSGRGVLLSNETTVEEVNKEEQQKPKEALTEKGAENKSTNQEANKKRLIEQSETVKQPNQVQKIETSPTQTATIDPAQLSQKVEKYLIDKLGSIVGDRSKVSDVNANLMDMGLESVQLVSMTESIEEETGIELFPTLFFEYPNIAELTEFFTEDHQQEFITLLGLSDSTQTEQDQFPSREGWPRSGRGVLLSNESQNSNNEGETTEYSQSEQDWIPESDDKISELDHKEKALNHKGPQYRDDIAIIGMSGLFADSTNPDEYWENIRDEKDLMKEVPLDHFDYRPWYHPERNTPEMSYCKWGSFIDDVDKFDAAFFSVSPREAHWMDPQLRLFLQSVYASAEDAGVVNQMRGTNTGVFVGVCFHDYGDQISELEMPMDPYSGTGSAQTVIANRVSFIFDFTGPSIAVDTACSSSLFALYSACHALRNNECDMAFVGGTNLLLSAWHYRYFSCIGALSSTGRCHTFDAAADGYTPGECVATVLLKPLQKAKQDGDRIEAIIKGCSALHGGYTPSLTAPSVSGEENTLLKAWEDARIDPATISYIEAHGTGTKLGDPIEVNALKKAFKKFTKKEDFCAIGSAKSNIGHAEGAAGIAGLIKVAQQMKHRQIPAMPKFENLNPYIALKKSPLYINRELIPWETEEGVPRRAGISSFGFSGAYAHVVMEEAPAEEPRITITVNSNNPAVIVLSARKEKQLRDSAQRLLQAVTSGKYDDSDLIDMAYTLQTGREMMDERLAMTVTSIKDLEEKLNAFIEEQDSIDGCYRGEVKRNREALASLLADEDMAQTIEAWMVKKKYAKLLDLWVKGMNFDWNRLYSGQKPRKISLPTYPFARDRYWVHELLPVNDPRRIEKSLAFQSQEQSTLKNLKNRVDNQNDRVETMKQESAPIAEAMDLLLGKLLFAQLKTLGWFENKIPNLAEIRAKLPTLYQRWFDETVAVLVRKNFLLQTEDQYTVTEQITANIETLWNEWDLAKGAWMNDPNRKAQVILVETTLRALPEILTGKRLATDVMFPNASMSLVEGIYKQNKVSDYFNEVLADTVVAYLQEKIALDNSAKIRILEIGAGTGGTSAMVFEKLKPWQNRVEEYCYTDLSKAFLMHAEREYGPENPFLTYKIFNASESVAEQGIEPGSFDLVIATNVLHATPNIRQTLRNAGTTLKNNGLILLNEISGNALFTHLTFGLLEGWWLYEDPEVRIPGCPGLSPENWKSVLESEYFRSVHYPAEVAHELGQQIVVAENYGSTIPPKPKQKVEVKPESTVIKQTPATQTKTVKKVIRKAVPAKITETSMLEKAQTVILEALSDCFKIESNAIDRDEQLSVYGLDSITASQIIFELNGKLNITLETTRLFEFTTVNQLANHLVDQFGQQIESGLKSETETTTVEEVEEVVVVDSGTNTKEAETAITAAAEAETVTTTEAETKEEIRQVIKESLSEALRVDISSIDDEELFSDYGLDSITGAQLVQQINDTLKADLETTRLFEYTTVNQLTDYLAGKVTSLPSQNLNRANNTPPLRGDRGVLLSTDSSDTDNRRWSKEQSNSEPSGSAKTEYDKNTQEQTDISGDTSIQEQQEAIAIVGISAQFPNARNIAEFWNNIAEGQNCITEIPADRWNWKEFYGDPEREPGKTNIKWGGFIDNVDRFDPLFFGISPKEATLMDPQQRLLMVHSWKAIEDAGIEPATLSKGTTGVFVATGPGEYGTLSPQGTSTMVPSVIPNYISYVLNLSGPSEYCETACSSTLVALHHAVRSILNNECDQALVGAVNLLLSPAGFIGFGSIGYLSIDGKAKSFQTDASGYARSEGVGAMLIKPLQKAIAEKNHIYGLIKGTGVAHGGKGLSLTAPNANGMKSAMKQAYQMAAIDPRTVSYIEAHGISAPLGDGIEINALKDGYRELTQEWNGPEHPESSCHISSLKPVIGHGEMVSGLAGIIKIIAAMKNETIPGIANFGTLNENISLAGSPFQMTAANRDWKQPTDANGNLLPRRASLNSYGYAGVNAHVVLEQYNEQPKRQTSEEEIGKNHLIVLSAKSQTLLTKMADNLLQFLANPSAFTLAGSFTLSDMAFTLQSGRKAMEHRLAMIANSRETLAEGLREYLKATEENRIAQGPVSIIAGKADGKAATNEELNPTGIDLETVALHWIKGGKVAWNNLYTAETIQTVALPTYPFEDERYWVTVSKNRQTTETEESTEKIQPKHEVEQKPKPIEESGLSNLEHPTEDAICNYIRHYLSKELAIEADKFDLETDLQDYGVDSIVGIKLAKEFEKQLQVKVTGVDMLKNRTIRALAIMLLEKITSGPTGRANQKQKDNADKAVDQKIENRINKQENSGPDLLDQFKEGSLTLEEMKNLIEQGEL